MTPEQEEQVRRALAAAKPEGAMPPEVVARLDATLARLVTEAKPEQQHLPPVDALAERRRRRWPQVLVAAASVSVLAYGVGVVVDEVLGSGGSTDSTAARDETFAEGGITTDDTTESAPGDVAPEAMDGGGEASRISDAQLLTRRTVRLSSATLDQDLRQLLRRATPRPFVVDKQESAGYLSSCAVPSFTRGDRLAVVRLDGEPGTLVVGKPVDGTRVAEIYSCDDATELRAWTRIQDPR